MAMANSSASRRNSSFHRRISSPIRRDHQFLGVGVNSLSQCLAAALQTILKTTVFGKRSVVTAKVLRRKRTKINHEKGRSSGPSIFPEDTRRQPVHTSIFSET